ncbi:uncharacterized protein LOC141652764 [Silene latifolia]|uniref:uncharacterized protein LOC141652764 n=1 Tax=Silene latifolia TaxID=37657 RepID=UPI003D76EFB0
MEQDVAERPFSQEQHVGQLHSWRNETDDRTGANLQNTSQSRDPRRWTVSDRNHMSNSNIDGKDIRENRGPSSVCRDNLRGKCSRGSFCKFQHTDPDGAQWNSGPTSEPGNSHSFGGNKDGDSYRRSPCRKFQQGNCYRGSACPYLHPQSTEFSSAGVDNSSRRPFFRESRERPPCRNFQNGHCNRGSSCSFLHSEFSESDRPMHKLNAGQQHRIVTASRNFGFHEGSVNNTFNTSQVHGVANKENNSRSSFSREPRRRSPCRNYLNGRCHFGSSCIRWHPDNANGHNWSAENSNNHDLAGGHQFNNLKTVPISRSPCHFIHRGNGYQGTTPANLHPATVYERTRYDLGARNHQVTATSRDLNFNRGNVVREENNQGVQPYLNTHPGYNRETINGSWRGSSSERKRSRPVSDFGQYQVQPEVCLRFTKGRCDQGGNCRYLHSFHEYASSITQPNQKPHLETTADLTSIDQAHQCAEGNENFNSWRQPFKRPRTWSRSSFSPEGNGRCRMLRRDYSLGDYHRSRPHHESQNQHPDYHPFKYYRPENHTNNEQHLRVAATSVIPHENTDFIVMAAAGQGELMSHRMHIDQCQSVCPRSEGAPTINQEPVERCETAGIKVDLYHEANENSEGTKHIMNTYSRKMRHNQHPNSYKCGVEYTMGDVTHASSRSLSINSSMGGTSLDYKSVVPGSVVSEDINTSVPKTGDIGDVLVSDHPVEEQGNETVTMKVQSTMVDSSTADTRDGSLLGVTDNSTLPASQSSDAAILSSRRKLLVLDVNGLLADIVSDFPDRFTPDATVGGKGVFKRPFCDNFLDFCFEKFDVGIWSSRTEKNVTRVLDCLMKNTKDKLLFCWHQSHCTQTGYKTVENNEKPLVLKELKKLWEKQEKDLPWKKGFYNEANTILLDDSPYKALRNPPYTAIFPFPYSFRNVGDKSLGPDGDLRLYLERLAEAENVQKFIQENPFGQRAITKTNLSWAFYSKIVGDYTTPQEPVAQPSSNSSEVNDVSQILLSLNAPAQPLG